MELLPPRPFLQAAAAGRRKARRRRRLRRQKRRAQRFAAYYNASCTSRAAHVGRHVGQVRDRSLQELCDANFFNSQNVSEEALTFARDCLRDGVDVVHAVTLMRNAAEAGRPEKSSPMLSPEGSAALVSLWRESRETFDKFVASLKINSVPSSAVVHERENPD
jgi:hypothetical protein